VHEFKSPESLGNSQSSASIEDLCWNYYPDFGRPLPALHSVAESIASTRWHVFFTLLGFQFLRWHH